jgi:hypothetical protein
MFSGYKAAEIPQMRRGRRSTRLRRVDRRTSESDLVDSETVGGEEEQVVVSPDERSQRRVSSGLEREFNFSFCFNLGTQRLVDRWHIHFADGRSIIQNKQNRSVPLINGLQNSDSMVPYGTTVPCQSP